MIHIQQHIQQLISQRHLSIPCHNVQKRVSIIQHFHNFQMGVVSLSDEGDYDDYDQFRLNVSHI